MDKELLELLNTARANGANESQMQGIVDAYNQKKKNGLNLGGGKQTEVLEEPLSNLKVDATGQLTQSVPTTLQSGLAENTNDFNPLKDIVSIQTSDDLGNPIIQQSNGSILSINPKTIPITPLANPKTYVSDLQKRIKSDSLTKQDEKVISENQKGNHNFDVADETELIDLVNKYDPQTSQLLNLPIPSILSNLLPDLQGKTFGEALNTTDGKLAATKLLKEKVYENFNKQYEGAEYVPDLDEGSKKELARLSEFEIKLGRQKNKSDVYPSFIDATVRKDESGNIWSRLKNRVLLLSPITAVQGMLGISAETEDTIQRLPDGFSIGLNGLKYTEPVEHERVINSLLKGEPISESQVGQITMQGLEAKEAMAKDAYVDKTITKEQYIEQTNEIQKDRYNAILDNKEITRSFLSDGIANLADDINSEMPSVTGSVDVAKKVFGHTWNYTDVQIEQYGKAVAQANGLDPNDARVKDAIKYLQDNEGWMITENSIAKAGFARDFAKGLASPIRGISATLEDIGKTTAEVYAESQSQGNVNVAEQKLKRVENSWEGAVSDLLEGTGQFVTQAGLSLGISGAIGAVGRGVLGRAGIAAIQGDIALADMAATDLVGKALLSSKDALATLITAGAQSYDGSLKQALSYTSDDNIARNVAKGMAGLEGATELFLSPITVARGIAKNLFNKATTAKGLVNILSDAAIVDKNSAVKNFLKLTLKAGLETSKVVGTEISEEWVVGIADYTSNSILNPESKTFQNRDLMNEMANTAYQTGLSMVLPALASGAGAANVNNFSKGSLLIAAQNRQQMLDDMNKRLFYGDMSQDEYNEKAAIINTAAVANETLPLKENGVKLNSEEKADYVFSRVSEGILKKKSEQSEDEAEKIILNKKIKEQQDFRVSLLGVKEEIAPNETAVVEPIVTTENKNIEPVVENNILTPEEQNAIDGFRGIEFTGSTKNWTDVLQSETSTPQEKKQVLTELKEQLSDPNSEIATGEALGKSADLIYGLIDADKTLKGEPGNISQPIELNPEITENKVSEPPPSTVDSGVVSKSIFDYLEQDLGFKYEEETQGKSGEVYYNKDGVRLIVNKKKLFQRDGSEAELYPLKGERAFTLEGIIVDKSQRGKSVASNVMKSLLEYADKTGTIIYLKPSNKFAKELNVEVGLSNQQLKEWYGKIGFVEQSPQVMVYNPKESSKSKPIQNEQATNKQANTDVPDAETVIDTPQPQQKPVPKVGDSARNFAKKVRQGKINKLGGFKASTGFDAVWDASLEIVAKTIETGASIADSIEAGLKYIKATDWYKSLSDQNDFDTKYMAHMDNEYKSDIAKEKRKEALKLRKALKDISTYSRAGLTKSQVETIFTNDNNLTLGVQKLINNVFGKLEQTPGTKQFEQAQEESKLKEGQKILDEIFSKIKSGQKVPRTFIRISSSDAADLVPYLKDKYSTYKAISLDQLEQVADLLLDRFGLDNAMDMIQHLDINEKPIAMAKVAMKLREEGRNKEAAKVMADLIQTGTATGQAISSFKRVKDIIGSVNDPTFRTEFQKAMYERIQSERRSAEAEFNLQSDVFKQKISDMEKQLHEKTINENKSLLSKLVDKICNLRKRK